MSGPVPRHAMRLPDRAIDHLLEAWPAARLATTGPDGRPHLVPVVFAREGGRIWSPVDGKPKAGGVLARVRNVEHDPRVSLLLDHYEADWSRLWWLRIDGEASAVRPEPGEQGREVAGAVAALRRKYPQYGTVPVLRDPPVLIAVRPTAIRSWCAGAAAVPEEG
ncbi:MAG: TIGR03668 family PPOX class F420-dependent oxidoreductase [Myxococcota bacterium]